MAKILFIQIGAGFRVPNKHLIKSLQSEFPQDEIHLIDLLTIVRKNPFIIGYNGICMIWEYLADFLSGNKRITRLHHYYLGTSYLFKVFSRLVRREVERNSYRFIIQTQGLCDSHNAQGTPFFIYTDHTNRNNLNYQYVKSKLSLHSGSHQNLEREAYEHARFIFVMSNNIRESLIKQYQINADKVKLVYAGANTSASGGNNEQKYYSKNIVFIGKDWVRKGGPLLIEAFKIVVQSIPDATLSIAGCKPKVILQNCKVYGEVSLEEVAKIYSEAAVFCMPTTLEPFGIVFLEAMANCLPIVTNDIGATGDFVIDGHNGYRLHNDSQEYANVLIKLLQDPDKCKTLGYNSCQIVKNNYTWDKVAFTMAQHIKESI
jgi:glycosyltransferase involved in cell wall biosynthesis